MCNTGNESRALCRVLHTLGTLLRFFYRFRFAPPVAKVIGVCSADFGIMNSRSTRSRPGSGRRVYRRLGRCRIPACRIYLSRNHGRSRLRLCIVSKVTYLSNSSVVLMRSANFGKSAMNFLLSILGMMISAISSVKKLSFPISRHSFSM